MIRINPATHLNAVSSIIQNKYLGILILALAIGRGLPVLGMIFGLLLTLFVRVFPFYLFFVLFINYKRGWAAGLIIWMGMSLVPLQLNIEVEYIRSLLEYLPLLFLVLYCFALTVKLKEWGYRQETGRSPFWF